MNIFLMEIMIEMFNQESTQYQVSIVNSFLQSEVHQIIKQLHHMV